MSLLVSFDETSSSYLAINYARYFSLDQAGQKRVKLGCPDHIVQGYAVMYSVSCFFVARTKADRGNPSLACPVDAICGEVPLAAGSLRQTHFLASLLSCLHQRVSLFQRPGGEIFIHGEHKPRVGRLVVKKLFHFHRI